MNSVGRFLSGQFSAACGDSHTATQTQSDTDKTALQGDKKSGSVCYLCGADADELDVRELPRQRAQHLVQQLAALTVAASQSVSQSVSQ